ncbi:hypothetical protein BBJ29_001242 [Phytophthora kernoviae]|uniref:Fungal lipase-type domain-containing protein n=1 Tax=Phytophthora kernoviae TaxID=325452 RepID=A0A3F2RXK2_9STRA|nr:hypothetical protein BBJ29_001242 [Phytophthora kernoviae]RLN65294.1 hypothetical protein BBP00_00002922 [Phytophthora kernoviae]
MRRLHRAARPWVGRRALSGGPAGRLDLDEFLGTRLRETAKELSVEVLPALKELLVRLLRYVRVCDAVYASSVAGFCEEADVPRDCVLRAHPGGVVSPKCVILADHEHREIVLVVRGTASLLDFCTDLCLQNEPFQNGQGHRGMVHAAAWLVHHLRDNLLELSKEYPDYRVVTTGHSLGAAVAALTAMQLHEEFPKLHCYAFGTPACVTRELATGSYDLVTSVVNGYDCVPRLHQHSLLKLQDEISRFDWRTGLRELVAEEIQKQKIAVEKQQRAKLEGLQQALRKMDHLQIKQRTNEATAKLDEVKRLASTNIKEFASDVDTLLADKLDAAFSIFKTDKLSLEHVTFVKNLLNLEDVQKGDSFWWKRMDESVLDLERLSAAVKKPEELERMLKELGQILQQTPVASAVTSLKGDDNAEPTQLQLFRSEVDGIIDKTRASLKEKISQQVSKVSSAVTTNVKEYVDTIKEETEALSVIVQEELDDVAATISQNLPFVMGLKNDDHRETEGQPSSQKKRGREVFADADPRERLEKVPSDEAGQQCKKPQTNQEQDNMLRHDPLFPPGRILYLNPVLAPGPSQCDTKHINKVSDIVEFVEVSTDEFSRVVLSNRMLLDHLCTDYERILQAQADPRST